MASEFAPCTEAQKQAVLDRLQVIRQNIADACTQSGRTVQDVTLMAVTKTVSPELINLAVDAGVTTLGETVYRNFSPSAMPTAGKRRCSLSVICRPTR